MSLTQILNLGDDEFAKLSKPMLKALFHSRVKAIVAKRAVIARALNERSK